MPVDLIVIPRSASSARVSVRRTSPACTPHTFALRKAWDENDPSHMLSASKACYALTPSTQSIILTDSRKAEQRTFSIAIIPAAATRESVRVDFPASANHPSLPSRACLLTIAFWFRSLAQVGRGTTDICQKQSTWTAAVKQSSRNNQHDSPWSTCAMTDMLRIFSCLSISLRS